MVCSKKKLQGIYCLLGGYIIPTTYYQNQYNPLMYLPTFGSKKSPTGPTERTPEPEYLTARSQLRGPLVRSHVIFDGLVDDFSK